ncbi:hypothetical protein EV580_1288 [Mycobacterium sp. BK086]|uniref:hypothetical protein n=1 Tax=Mycobacterium sp. BK086 TaxID=2512165 RepID=UPI00105D1E86|nr:hypothetical protein [Mycobacterium sp. BK086]TDO18107.1 hypothetical protein EV580_1288 [Mycobacterium sp. BK086]
MSTYVTSVTLSMDVDEDGRPMWRLDWTESRKGRAEASTMSHYTEQAARRHATSLVAKRRPGIALADVFIDARGR